MCVQFEVSETNILSHWHKCDRKRTNMVAKWTLSKLFMYTYLVQIRGIQFGISNRNIPLLK